MDTRHLPGSGGVAYASVVPPDVDVIDKLTNGIEKVRRFGQPAAILLPVGCMQVFDDVSLSKREPGKRVERLA